MKFSSKYLRNCEVRDKNKLRALVPGKRGGSYNTPAERVKNFLRPHPQERRKRLFGM